MTSLRQHWQPAAAAAAIVTGLLLLSGCALPSHNQSLRAVVQQELDRSHAALPAFRCTLGAHRGASVEFLENSLQALAAAEADPRYAFIEFDVQYSRDEQIIVFHDRRLRRLFERFDSISNLSYAEIQLLSQGQIPLYRDVIDTLDKHLNIEIKSQGDDQQDARLADELIADLRERGKLDDVMISSISEQAIRYIKSQHPEIPTGQIFWVTSSTFLHFDRLTERLYEKFSRSQADYLMLNVENLRNIENLLKLKPKGKTIVFWDFEDNMYLVHSTLSDRLWGRSALGNFWEGLRYKLSAPTR